MTSKFETEFKLLNPEQKRAVENIEGPMIVLAGPGTGKTQLLSMRAANILKKTDSMPENILCLTFTEKAATNMQDRLLSIIGPEARKITVKTFHGLGAEIFNNNPEFFWGGAKLNAIPETKALEIIDKILSSLPVDSPLALNYYGEYTQVQNVFKSIKLAKDAGLTPDKLEALLGSIINYIDVTEPILKDIVNSRVSKNFATSLKEIALELPQINLSRKITPIPSYDKVFSKSIDLAIDEYIETGKTTSLSKWKARWFESQEGQKVFKDRKRLARWVDLVKVYREYQDQLRKAKYFDFADMIIEAIDKVENNESLRLNLQERFNYVMIDEFQDTNSAQFRLAYLLVNNPVNENSPNIMVVGDDDQAIYRFQGAEISNSQAFINSFENVEKIVLTDSYRSHQIILDAAQKVAKKIEYRLVNVDSSLNKELNARSAIKRGNAKHIVFDNQVLELNGIATAIKKAWSANRTVAVLSRKHKPLMELASILDKLKVHIRYEKSSNILEHDLVILILNVLKYLESLQEGAVPLSDKLLSTILSHPAMGIEAHDLWEIAIDMRRKNNWTQFLLSKSNNISNLVQWLLELSKASKNLPLVQTLEIVIGIRDINNYSSPLKKYFKKSDHTYEYIETLAAVRKLRQVGMDFAGGQEPNLENFNKFIALGIDHKVNIDATTIYSSGEQSVHLMTIHAAKGLEFDDVYIIDCQDKVWRPKNNNLKAPESLDVLQEYGEDLDDYARLMYVAITRARQNVYLSSYKFEAQGSEALYTPLIYDLPKEDSAFTGNPIEVAEYSICWPRLERADERDLLKPLLENFQLPVTSLQQYLDVSKGGPQRFLERSLLRLPDIKSPTLSFGTAMHAALEFAHKQVQQSDTIDQLAVFEVFAESLKTEQLEAIDFQRYKTHGQNLIKRLFSENKLHIPTNSRAEYPIENVRLENSVLRGNIDRIDIEDMHLVVVDYKTGKSVGNLAKEIKSDDTKGHFHRMQLAFYTLLLEDSAMARGKAIKGKMIYLEETNPKKWEQTYTPSKEDLDRLRKLIKKVWSKINKLEFPDTSRYGDDLVAVKRFEDELLEDKV